MQPGNVRIGKPWKTPYWILQVEARDDGDGEGEGDDPQIDDDGEPKIRKEEIVEKLLVVTDTQYEVLLKRTKGIEEKQKEEKEVASITFWNGREL